MRTDGIANEPKANGDRSLRSNGRARTSGSLVPDGSTLDRIDALGSRARSGSGRLLLEALFRRPVTNAERVATVADVSKPTAYKLIATFEELGILREFTGAKRNRLYSFQAYLQLFK